MLVPTYVDAWLGGTAGTVRLDPTRMAQGVLTGIGFLGAVAVPLDRGADAALLGEHGFSVASMSDRVEGEGRNVEYRMVVRTRTLRAAQQLAETPRRRDVVDFRIAPTGD